MALRRSPPHLQYLNRCQPCLTRSEALGNIYLIRHPNYFCFRPWTCGISIIVNGVQKSNLPIRQAERKNSPIFETDIYDESKSDSVKVWREFEETKQVITTFVANL
jgi:hypothetical protein